ncbi:hypothetical protein Syun_011981 [Stephania yunnanensis]|uniref:Uncharacterized protein n=1 Tax=Stephania yunnanensis TaxID=152371 RepID=A0AAP0JYJ7_9MAGN
MEFCLNFNTFKRRNHDARQVRIRRHELGALVAVALPKANGLLRAEPVEGFTRRGQVVVDAGDAGVQQQSNGVAVAPVLRAALEGFVGQQVLGAAQFVVGKEGGSKMRNDKGWPECNVIQEEGDYGDLDGDRGISRRCQALIALLGFVLLFTVFSLILWGASRPYKAEIVMKSLSVDNFYFGEGSDGTGVPTKMLIVNC